MKTIKAKLFILLGMLIPFLTASCSDKKTGEKAETAGTTANTESVINLPAPPFEKFVVVTTEEAGLYKKADTNSPTLVNWIEADCESDMCENVYQWSDEPAKPGFEISTDILAYAGRVFPVLGEEGNFYKVCTLNEWCLIESAYISKDEVGDIETAPIKADLLEAGDLYYNCLVVKDGKYKDIVLIDEFNELDGETLQVGVLKDGVVATPVVGYIYSYLDKNLNEGIIIDDSEDEVTIRYSKSMSTAAEEEYISNLLNLKELSAEQIAKIVDTMTKKTPEYVNYMYHFPAQGLESFYYKAK